MKRTAILKICARDVAKVSYCKLCLADGGFMAKSVAVKQLQCANESAWFAGSFSVTYMGFLTTVRQLLGAYQHAGGFEQRQIPPTERETDAGAFEALVEVMPRARREGHSA